MRDPGDECDCKECERIMWEDILADEHLSYKKDMRQYEKDLEDDFKEAMDAAVRALDTSRH